MGWQTLKNFLSWAPFFALAIYSGGIYDEIRRHAPIPDTVPMHATLKAGQGITCIISSLALIWNFFEFGLSTHYTTGEDFLISGFIDFLVGLLLLTGVGLQSTYLPHTTSACASASTWRVEGQVNVINLFTWIGDIDGTAPEDVCQEFMTIWVLGMVLGIYSIFTSYIAIRQAKNPLGTYNRGRTAPEGIDLFGRVLGWIPHLIISPLKYKVRWLQKWRRRSPTKNEKKKDMKKLPQEMALTKLPSRHSAQPSPRPKLLELLSSYPILTAIAENLHYADLIELSKASKDVREVLFPSFNVAARLNIQQQCCTEGEKAQCWACNRGICISAPPTLSLTPGEIELSPKEGCGLTKTFLEPKTAPHLSNCSVFCSNCFRTTLCNTAPPRELSMQCRCHIQRRNLTSGQVCRFCATYSNDSLISAVEEEEKKKLLVKASKQLTCGRCNRRLPMNGPRWWCCQGCGRECRSKHHPQWAKSAEV